MTGVGIAYQSCQGPYLLQRIAFIGEIVKAVVGMLYFKQTLDLLWTSKCCLPQ